MQNLKGAVTHQRNLVLTKYETTISCTTGAIFCAHSKLVAAKAFEMTLKQNADRMERLISSDNLSEDMDDVILN